MSSKPLKIFRDDFSLPIKQEGSGRYTIGKAEYIAIEEYDKLKETLRTVTACLNELMRGD